MTGIGDDAAVLQFNQQSDLLWTVDTLVEGVHFFKDASATDIAHKVLAVNLSDIAAMGGQAKWMSLSLTLSENDPLWLEAFSSSLKAQQQRYGINLIGGDTVKGPHLSITINLMGMCDKGKALTRSNAREGDVLYVTGTLGDAALALKLIATRSECATTLRERLNRPNARYYEGLLLSQYANSAIDISDGLLGDVRHILESSHVSARISLAHIPLSKEVRQHIQQHSEDWNIILAGGDDYELCFTVSPENEEALLQAWKQTDLSSLTKIGIIEADKQEKITLVDKNGREFDTAIKGFQHF